MLGLMPICFIILFMSPRRWHLAWSCLAVGSLWWTVPGFDKVFPEPVAIRRRRLGVSNLDFHVLRESQVDDGVCERFVFHPTFYFEAGLLLAPPGILGANLPLAPIFAPDPTDRWNRWNQGVFSLFSHFKGFLFIVFLGSFLNGQHYLPYG